MLRLLLAREAREGRGRLLRGMLLLEVLRFGVVSDRFSSGVPTMTQVSLSVWRRLLGGRTNDEGEFWFE